MNEARYFGYTPFSVYLSTMHYFARKNDSVLIFVKTLKLALRQMDEQKGSISLPFFELKSFVKPF